MATANLGRTRRLDKTYSRARDRADLQRTIDEDLSDEFAFPIMQLDVADPDAPSLASMMNEPPGEEED